MGNKIDSNVVGLAYAEETSLKVLPGTGGVDAIWRPLDPNEYGDFGADIKTIARNPISADRQRKKGVVSDLDASGSIVQDVTQNNLTRLMQGFFFANLREKVNTAPLNVNAPLTVGVTSFGAGTIVCTAGSGAKFVVGNLILVTGMVNSVNNGLFRISAITTDTLTVVGTTTTVVETFPATGRVEVVGFELADNTASLAIANGLLELNISSGTFLNRNMNVGEWIYIGGDTLATRFSGTTNRSGYARIESIAATKLTLSEPTWVAANEAAASGKTIRVFTGSFLRNEESAALIRTRSYNIERTLGQDDFGVQSEYLEGAVANEYELKFDTADKLTADLSFIALNQTIRNGTTGVKAGTRLSVIDEDAFNTSNDVFQLRIFVYGTTPTPASLFAYAQEGSIMVKNNCAGAKAIGVLGSFDVNVGSFDVDSELTVYFSDVAAIQAIKDNASVGFNMITAQRNAGIVYDIPLLTIQGGRPDIKANEPIALPLKNQGAKSRFGFTIAQTYFAYLPTVAMPVV